MSREHPVDWNPEAVELLWRMWAEAYPARVIAEKIPRATRFAVIGKAHRLGLQRGVRLLTRSPVPRPPAPVPELRGLTLTFMDAGRCAHCGKTAQPGRVLCAEHITLRIEMNRPNKRASMWNGIGDRGAA